MKVNIASLYDSGIPEYMHGGIVRFYENGIHPGSFLAAVINNDLRDACMCADDTNRELLFDYVRWFYNHAPIGSWGFPEAVDQWLEAFHSEAKAAESC